MASTSTPPLQNIYYERKVATERPCYICKRPTATVLATLKTEDFLYTCTGHLTDPGFAILLTPPAPTSTTPTPSAEDIKKVVEDYKSREAKKKDTDKDKEKEKEKGESPAPTSPSPAAAPTPAPAVPAPAHRKFALHRQIWDMRRAELKRREQGVKAKEVGKGMPQVPRGAF